MATITVQTPTQTGAALTRASIASGGDAVPNNGRTYVIIKNGGGVGSLTVTITSPATVDGLAVADITLTIPKTTNNEQVAGPFNPTVFNNGGGAVAFTYSGDPADIAASTIAAISL